MKFTKIRKERKKENYKIRKKIQRGKEMNTDKKGKTLGKK